MAQRVRQRLEREGENFEQLARRMTRSHPRRRLNEKLQQLDDLRTGLSRGLKQRRRQCQMAALILHQRLARLRPAQFLVRRHQAVRELKRRLNEQTRTAWKTNQNRLATMAARLRLLSPANVLERGYSITMDAVTGKVIHAADEVKRGQRLKTRLNKGQIRSVVEGE
jgi:exodeoxyribonuclease VII large subunit